MQEKYAEQVTKTHGEDFDWENQPVDSQAVYVSGGGKAHGRWDAICFSNFVNENYYSLLIFITKFFLRFAMFPGVLDSREARPSRGSSSQSSPSFSPRISQRDLQVQKMEEQLKQTQEELAAEKAANKAKDDYLAAHLAKLQQAFTVRKHNTKHPFCFSDICTNTLQL